MQIVYFHGYASSGASGTVELLRKALPDDEVSAPDIPVDPIHALPYLQQYCAEHQPDLIIGTSMGGMYAQQMHGYRKICVNPAFFMSRTGLMKCGEHPFLNGRKDHQKTFRISRDTLRHFDAMERMQFKGITDFDKENTYGLFGIHDPLIHTYDTFKKYYSLAIRFDGAHQLNDKALRTAVLPLIGQIRAGLQVT